MANCIHGDTAPQEREKKSDLRGCDSCCSPLLQQKWKRCTDSSKGFFIYVQEAYSFTQTYQVGFVLHCLCAHNHLCPSVDYEKNFSKLFKCIAVEVNIFTQSSTLQFLIQQICRIMSALQHTSPVSHFPPHIPLHHFFLCNFFLSQNYLLLRLQTRSVDVNTDSGYKN